MELQTKIVENGVELGVIENGRISLDNVDVETLGRLYALLSKTTQNTLETQLSKTTQNTLETQPIPGDEYQGGIYLGEFQGKKYVVSKDEVERNWNGAKEWCENYSKEGFNDWFLPNKDELNFLYESEVIEEPSICYWSSTENSSTDTWVQHFSSSVAGFQSSYYMTGTYSVRAVRVVI